jgi:hypothetical protein
MQRLLNSVRRSKASTPRANLRCSDSAEHFFHYPTEGALEYDFETIRQHFDDLYDVLDAVRVAKTAAYVKAMLAFKKEDLLMQGIANGDVITLHKTGLSISRPAIIELVLCSGMLSNNPAGIDLAWGFIVIIWHIAKADKTLLQQIRDAQHQAYAFACANEKWAAALRMFVLYDREGESFQFLKTASTKATAGNRSIEWQAWAEQLKNCSRQLAKLANETHRCPACSGRVVRDFSKV